MDAAITNTESAQSLSDEQSSWADLFVGMLVRPIATLKYLDAVSDSHIYKRCTQAFNTVFLSACMLGLARIKPTDIFSVLFDLISALTNEMALWVTAAALLSLLSAIISGARPTKWKKALVLTGWSFAPIMFFAPLICLKNALGAMVLPIMTLPTWWSLFLLFSACKIALGISGRKLLVLFLVVPPVLFVVYAFWTGLSFCLMLVELVSAFAK